jgi:AcrR family transcriptional regulator
MRPRPMSARAASPQRMSAKERREQLLDATKRIVSERGFHAVSIEAVAREAGITRPIVYGHFHDLQGLLQALVDREGARALGQLAAVLPRDLAGGDPRDTLLTALRGYLEAVRADPTTWRLVLMPPEGAPTVLHDQIARGRSAVVEHLAQAVGPGLGPGRASSDPELFARTLSAISDEFARLMLTDPERYPVERIIGFARSLLDQLAP